MRNLLVFILLIVLSTQALQAKVHFIQVETPSQWEAVIDTAKKYDKIIFADIYAEWCEPCQELDNKTFLDKELYNYFNQNLLAVKIASDTEFGLSFVEKHELRSVPVMYFMDPAGNIISEQIRGYRTAVKLLEAAEYFNEQYHKLLQLKEEFYGPKRNHTITLSYAYMLLHLNYFEEAGVIADQYFTNVDVFSYSPEEWILVKQFVNDINNPLSLKIAKEADAYMAVNGKEDVTKYFDELFRYNYALAIQEKDEARMENTLLLVDKIDVTSAGLYGLETEQLRDFFRISFYERLGDWKMYAEKVVEYVGDNEVTDNDLRNFIQNFYLFVDDSDMMIIADSWAFNLLKKEKIFENYVMYCLTQHKTSNEKKAFKLLKKAEKKAESEDELKTIDTIKQQFGQEILSR
jgi:thioredoxin-related protein